MNKPTLATILLLLTGSGLFAQSQPWMNGYAKKVSKLQAKIAQQQESLNTVLKSAQDECAQRIASGVVQIHPAVLGALRCSAPTPTIPPPPAATTDKK